MLRCILSKLSAKTAFTPNNDGYNDFYLIELEDDIVTKFKLEIFNRIGQKVYEANDINFTWDGTFNGEPLPAQVFDFYIELDCVGKKSFFHKGNITLIK